jgi:hypothetical protein
MEEVSLLAKKGEKAEGALRGEGMRTGQMVLLVAHRERGQWSLFEKTGRPVRVPSQKPE